MMKFCAYCGTEMLSEEAAFCMGCGRKLPQGNERTKKKRSGVKGRKEEEADRKEKTGRTRRNNAITRPERTEYADSRSEHYETDDVMEMYGKDQTTYDESMYHEETEHYAPPTLKRRRLVDDYDGYYDDVVPYDKGRVREDNILEMVKKVFVIIIAALLIVAVCVVMMYVL